MSAPDDELVEALLHRIKVGLATVPAGGPTDRLLQQCSEVIRALRDALARDAQVREIVQRMRGLQAAARPIMRPPLAEIAANDIAALYPSPGDGWGVWGEDDIPARLISEEQR